MAINMAGNIFPLESWMAELQINFHRQITNGITPEMLNEQVIGPAPNFFSVEAVHIDPCLTDEHKRKARGSQGLSVFGLNVNGNRWNLRLRKENETYFFSEMAVANGWEQGTGNKNMHVGRTWWNI